MPAQPISITTHPDAIKAPDLTPAAAWSRRVRRIGGFIQAAFAAFWLARASLAIGGRAGDILLAASGLAVIGVFSYAIKVTAGTAPRPAGPEARRIERSVTLATVIELAAAVVLPVIVIAAGRPDWVLLSVVIRIGPLLLWLDHLVHIPRYRVVGWALTAGPGHHVRLVARRDHRPRRRRRATGRRRRRLPRPRRHPGCPSARPSLAQHKRMIMPQADKPTAGFRPFFNPATGEWITYTAIAEDSGGQLVRFSWRSVPGGVITEHIHPHQEERFTILAGQARFTLAGEELVAGAGETVIVPVGVPHFEGNPGPAEIDGIVELRPALHTKEWHEALAGLAADGKTTSRGAPRNPLQLGATFWHFRHESRVTSPPSGCRTSCSPRYGHWPKPSASAPTTTAGTAGPGHPDQATHIAIDRP
jgi:quercetin dioxygenase-like cupin family protein